MIEKFTPIHTSGPLPAHCARQTVHFYSWEKCGRGWQTWDYAVDLEPPFERFAGHTTTPTPVVDDAREPSLLRSLFGRSKARVGALPATEDCVGLRPLPANDFEKLIEIHIALPPKLKITPQATEQFLLSLANFKFPLSLEIVGLAQSVSIQLACDKEDQSGLEQQLLAYFPDAVLSEQSAFLSEHWRQLAGQQQIIVDFGLASEFLRPLATTSSFDPDPLTAVVGALSRLRGNEIGLLQVLFRATRHPWAESMMRAISDKDGRPFFADAPDSLTLARQKVSRPLFAAVVRVAAKAASDQRVWRIVRTLGGAFNQLANPASNHLVPLTNEGLSPSAREADLLERRTHRSGMILNSEELSCLVHLPSASLRSEKLVRDTRRKKAAPQIAIGNELELGYNDYRGRKTRVSLSRDQRLRHMFVAGATGSGKTTLLKAMAIADIEHGYGVCVIDPHGDLIDELLGHVPERRHSDVIVIDPGDESPVPLNVLSGHTQLERTLLASDLTSIFRRLASTTWGDQMDAVLNNAILAFVESDRGGTLIDLRRFLTEADFREEFLESVTDEEVLYFWRKQFPVLKGNPQAPILTRLNAFLRPKPIRQMVSQPEGLDFRAIMDGNQILFVRLAQGAIGVENSHFLGSLILSKLHQIALSRQDIEESERRPFFIFCDELQFFLSPSVAALLSGARKFGVGLTAASQDFFALWRMDQQIASAILANAYTRICFRLSDIDAKRLQSGFSFFEASDLQNLGVGEAIARVERNEFDFNLVTSPVPQVDQTIASRRREQIISLSRQNFARKSDPVEPDLCNSRGAANKSLETRNTNKLRSEPVVPEVFQNHPQLSRSTPSIIPSQTLGRGGQQHKYLQNLIKRLAEDKGFRVTIEQSVLSGTGCVDVSMERAGRKIACEISVSSTCEYECKNIQKCLAAGFDKVVVLSSERKTLVQIQQLIANEVSADSQRRILFVQPEEFILFLDEMDNEQLSTEKTVRGYKVKVKHKASKHSEQKAQRHAVAQVVLQALKRLKDSD